MDPAVSTEMLYWFCWSLALACLGQVLLLRVFRSFRRENGWETWFSQLLASQRFFDFLYANSRAHRPYDYEVDAPEFR